MVRMFRVEFSITFVLIFAAVSIGGAPPTYGQQPGKRTIVESLDDIVDANAKRMAKTGDYDFSVTRELLPPIDGEPADAQTKPGWVTVVAARDLETGSLPTPQSSPWSQLMLFGCMLALASALLIWRVGGPRLSSVFQSARIPLSVDRLTLKPIFGRLGTYRLFAYSPSTQTSEDTPKWDAETENASLQMRQLLAKIEGVVVQLKDGSPLRDVLNQELRLIHYRISAASDAARNGHDSSEKSAARFRGLVRELERVRRIADSAAASVVDPTDHLALPQTPSEAYALLGVNPDASPPVLKKLVDALRVTWHPDHSRDESDRLLREERMKQINTAWDLINSDVR